MAVPRSARGLPLKSKPFFCTESGRDCREYEFGGTRRPRYGHLVVQPTGDVSFDAESPAFREGALTCSLTIGFKRGAIAARKKRTRDPVRKVYVIDLVAIAAETRKRAAGRGYLVHWPRPGRPRSDHSRRSNTRTIFRSGKGGTEDGSGPDSGDLRSRLRPADCNSLEHACRIHRQERFAVRGNGLHQDAFRIVLDDPLATTEPPLDQQGLGLAEHIDLERAVDC
jgi:hypothetical protein